MLRKKARLLENIEAKISGKRIANPSPIEYISFERSDDKDFHTSGNCIELKIFVSLGATEHIDEEIYAQNPDEVMQMATNRIRRLVAHHVYGEVRDKLIELSLEMRRSISHRDEKSIRLIDEIFYMIEE
jgi:hypothetical protein